MSDIVLYCKSYQKDFLRLKRLYESIKKFNIDSIPFYVSTPESDKEVLYQLIDLHPDFKWVSDESIIESNSNNDLKKISKVPGYKAQAAIKAEFWRLGFSENYICLDSDCFFIREFKRSDFLTSEGLPYTVLHQNKELFQLAIDRGYDKFVLDLKAEAKRTRELFSREGAEFFCAPAPFIWSAKVWQDLDRQFLSPKKKTLWDLFIDGYPETLIYGEALMKYKSIPIISIEPLFRVYHYDWQYYLAKKLGENTFKVAKNYLGIINQSNWESELDYGADTKPLFSRILKRVKRFLKYLSSYL